MLEEKSKEQDGEGMAKQKDYIKSFGVGLTYEKTLDDWGNKKWFKVIPVGESSKRFRIWTTSDIWEGHWKKCEFSEARFATREEAENELKRLAEENGWEETAEDVKLEEIWEDTSKAPNLDYDHITELECDVELMERTRLEEGVPIWFSDKCEALRNETVYIIDIKTEAQSFLTYPDYVFLSFDDTWDFYNHKKKLLRSKAYKDGKWVVMSIERLNPGQWEPNPDEWLDDGCRRIRGIEIISESVCRDGKSNYSFYEQEGWY